MTMDRDGHWNRVYEGKDVDAVSWYAPHLGKSLELIAAADLAPDAAIIDVGGGASTLPADLLELPAERFDLWHDRAVFHFLTDEADRAAYLRQVSRALKPDGRVIVATFGPGGPEKCSGLPVVRYDDVGLQRQFGAQFERVQCLEESHETPWGSEQAFVYCLCRRVEV